MADIINKPEPSAPCETEVDKNQSKCEIAVIDHLAYPHIMDRIIYYADAAALLSLRPTCKQYAERCLTLVANHLVLRRFNGLLDVESPPSSEDEMSIRRVLGRHYGPTVAVESIRGPLPHVHKGLDFLSDLESRLLKNPHFFKTCRIVTVLGPHRVTVPRSFSEWLANVKTLRFLPARRGEHHRSYMQGPDLVVYTGSLPLMALNTSTYRWQGPKFPSSTNKLVWNVTSFDVTEQVDRPAEQATVRGRDRSLGARRTQPPDVDVFFYPTSTIVLNFKSSERFLHSEALARFIRSISILATKFPSTSIKMINFTLALFRSFGDIEKQEAAYCKRVSLLTGASLRGRTSLITSDEYRAEVGDEQFKFEMCSSL